MSPATRSALLNCRPGDWTYHGRDYRVWEDRYGERHVRIIVVEEDDYPPPPMRRGRPFLEKVEDDIHDVSHAVKHEAESTLHDPSVRKGLHWASWAVAGLGALIAIGSLVAVGPHSASGFRTVGGGLLWGGVLGAAGVGGAMLTRPEETPPKK